MEKREQSDLTNPELDVLLREWKTPVAPAGLRSALFPRQLVPWYRRWFAASIRVPVPVAVVLSVLLVLSAWLWGSTKESAHRVSVRDSIASAAPPFIFQGFSPVAELRPRIIRSHDAPN